jgi:small-conductance mechanosensitive channel
MWRGVIDRLPFIAIAAVVFLFIWGASTLAARLTAAAGRRARRHANVVAVLSRLVSFAGIVVGLLVASVIVFPAFRPGDLVAGLGITSVAVGFAFKDILQNFFAGILILWRQPFDVGDEIRSGIYEGVVEDITTRSTRIRTYDGERAIIPNGEVFTNPILVRTAYTKRRVRLTVGIGYGDSIEEARKLILDVVSRTEGVLDDPGPWAYVEELAPSAVNFTIYFWTESMQRNVLAVRNRVTTAVKLALDESGIDMPYPHTVVLLEDRTPRRAEGG